jgi:hypothetical protein
MRWRFFRRLSIVRNVWLNLSPRGVSLTTGVRGLRITFGRGRTRITAGLPGTGLSVSQDPPFRGSEAGASMDAPEPTAARLLDKALRSK